MLERAYKSPIFEIGPQGFPFETLVILSIPLFHWLKKTTL